MDVLLKKNGRYYQTRLNARKRYLNTIKPLDDFINYCYEEEQKENGKN